MYNLTDKSFLAFDNDPQMHLIYEMLLQRVQKSDKILVLEDAVHLDQKLTQLSFIPDAVFLDLKIRPLDGYAILQKLQQNSLFQTSKFIAVTAKVMQNDIIKMQHAGFHGLISKPIIRQVFPELVQRILAGESVWYIA